MKWIESVTNIALCQQVALDSVLETSYEQDTVKEFTTRHQEQFLPYDAPQQSSQNLQLHTQLELPPVLSV